MAERTMGTVLSPIASAASAGLAYVNDRRSGISRVRTRDTFRYKDSKGRAIRDRAILKRIQALVIPPNWTRVWICSNPNGHLQATGRDARNRKQYRYHPQYRAFREEVKFEKMTLFGELLPKIRQRIEHDLALPGLPKDKVLATVVRLMDLTHIRIGNEEYARENGSFGLTTMRNRHVELQGSRIHFQFRGKSGQLHALDVRDPQLARIVKRCLDVPGYELFQYIDESGDHIALDSGMVNTYLREISGEEITAKDFRTWHGTVHAFEHLGACCDSATETEVKHQIVAAIKAVADRLGNRPATCRKYYVHPIILELYSSGKLSKYVTDKVENGSQDGLKPCEYSVLRLLTEIRETVAA